MYSFKRRFFAHRELYNAQCTYVCVSHIACSEFSAFDICTIFHAVHTFPITFFPRPTSHNNENPGRSMFAYIFFSFSFSICSVVLNDDTKIPSTVWITTFSRPYIKANENSNARIVFSKQTRLYKSAFNHFMNPSVIQRDWNKQDEYRTSLTQIEYFT